MKFLKFDKDFILHMLPFLGLYLLLTFLGVAFLNRLFFSIAYLWHVLLAHPNIKAKAESDRYRFAFLKLVYVLDMKVQELFNKGGNRWLRAGLRALNPIIFISLLAIIGNRGNPLYGVMGSLVIEGIIFARYKQLSVRQEN